MDVVMLLAVLESMVDTAKLMNVILAGFEFVSRAGGVE